MLQKVESNSFDNYGNLTDPSINDISNYVLKSIRKIPEIEKILKSEEA